MLQKFSPVGLFLMWLTFAPNHAWSLEKSASSEVIQTAQSLTEQAPSQKRSRWAIFFEAGGGIGLGLYFGQEIHPDISILQYQGVFGGGIGGNFYLVDGCQGEKISRPTSCADVLLSAELGASYWFNSLFLDAQGRLGIEVDAFLGHQRAVALTAKVQVGLGLAFQVDTSVRDRYSIYDGHSTYDGPQLLVFAGPGILLNLGALSKAKGLSLFWDTQYSGLRVRFDGFLVSMGLRYRF